MTARTVSDRVRLFFALWPDASARAALAQAGEVLQKQCGGRATPSEKIHLTLFFLGALERLRVRAIEESAASVEGQTFELALDRIGYWRRNGIVWAGARTPPSALAALAAALRAALAREGVHDEERPYAPHVTLVRDVLRRPAGDPALACSWRAREFVLVQSVPVAGGVRYDAVAAWPLLA